MNWNEDLQEGLRALASTTPREASPLVRQRVLLRFRERRGRGKRRRAYLAALAASAALAAGLYALSHGRAAAPPVVSPAAEDQTAGFIALPYAQSEVPLEQPVIVRIDIPVSELGTMGVPYPPIGVRGRVRADFLVGQDGVARAVKFVP